MKLLIDTNIPLVANGEYLDASDECIEACEKILREIVEAEMHVLVLDDDDLISTEYGKKLLYNPRPMGNVFLQWVLINQANEERCHRVLIPLKNNAVEDTDFRHFPDDTALEGFDKADRKFVAVAIACDDHPPIYNATDSDWWKPGIEGALKKYGVEIVSVCNKEKEAFLLKNPTEARKRVSQSTKTQSKLNLKPAVKRKK